jgi:hypothetical protein
LLNDLARINYNLGYVAVLLGDLSAGQAYLNKSLGLFRPLGNLRGQTECLDGYAALAGAACHHTQAAQLLGAADASFESLGAGRWPVDLLEYQKLRGKLEEKLGADIFNALHASGMTLDLDQAFQLIA